MAQDQRGEAAAEPVYTGFGITGYSPDPDEMQFRPMPERSLSAWEWECAQQQGVAEDTDDTDA